jgi:hypothetical protein
MQVRLQNESSESTQRPRCYRLVICSIRIWVIFADGSCRNSGGCASSFRPKHPVPTRPKRSKRAAIQAPCYVLLQYERLYKSLRAEIKLSEFWWLSQNAKRDARLRKHARRPYFAEGGLVDACCHLRRSETAPDKVRLLYEDLQDFRTDRSISHFPSISMYSLRRQHCLHLQAMNATI